MPFKAPDGTAAAPAYTWSGDTDTGLYRIGSNNVGFSAGGTLRWDYNTTRILSTLLLNLPNGTISAPALTFGDTGTGFWRSASQTWTWSTGSGAYLTIDGDLKVAAGSLVGWTGSGGDSTAALDTSLARSAAGTVRLLGTTPMLQLGGTSSSFPAIKRVGNAVALRLADDTVPAFAALTACAAGLEGALVPVTDSSTATWGATITGGGANHVLAYCNGTNWTVAGK